MICVFLAAFLTNLSSVVRNISAKKAVSDWEFLLQSNDFDPLPSNTLVRAYLPSNGLSQFNLTTPPDGDLVIFFGYGTPPLKQINTALKTVAQADVPFQISPRVLPIPLGQDVDYDYIRARLFGIKYQLYVGSVTFNKLDHKFSTAHFINPQAQTPNNEGDDIYLNSGGIVGTGIIPIINNSGNWFVNPNYTPLKITSNSQYTLTISGPGTGGITPTYSTGIYINGMPSNPPSSSGSPGNYQLSFAPLPGNLYSAIMANVILI